MCLWLVRVGLGSVFDSARETQVASPAALDDYSSFESEEGHLATGASTLGVCFEEMNG